MKQFLPYFFRKIGIALFIISFVLSMIGAFHDAIASDNHKHEKVSQSISSFTEISKQKIPTPIFNEKQRRHLKNSAFILALSGLLLYSFSKEKVDDEFLAKLRANALLKSFIVSWIIFALMMVLQNSTKADMLGVLQIQMLVYVIVYAYTKKVKYAE
jgi:hypothetical protein